MHILCENTLAKSKILIQHANYTSSHDTACLLINALVMKNAENNKSDSDLVVVVKKGLEGQIRKRTNLFMLLAQVSS